MPHAGVSAVFFISNNIKHLLAEIPTLTDKPMNEAKVYSDKLHPWLKDAPENLRISEFWQYSLNKRRNTVIID